MGRGAKQARLLAILFVGLLPGFATASWVGGALGVALAGLAFGAWVTCAVAAYLANVPVALAEADVLMADGRATRVSTMLLAQRLFLVATVLALGSAGGGLVATSVGGGFVLGFVNVLAVGTYLVVARAVLGSVRATHAIHALNYGDPADGFSRLRPEAHELAAEALLRQGDVDGALLRLARAGVGTPSLREAEIRVGRGDLALARAVLGGASAGGVVHELRRECLWGQLAFHEGRSGEIVERTALWRGQIDAVPGLYGDGQRLILAAACEATGDRAHAQAWLAEERK